MVGGPGIEPGQTARANAFTARFGTILLFPPESVQYGSRTRIGLSPLVSETSAYPFRLPAHDMRTTGVEPGHSRFSDGRSSPRKPDGQMWAVGVEPTSREV